MAVGEGNAVLMLLGNTCINDTRVLKEAQSLSQAGYRVSVCCDNLHAALGDALHDGVYLRRVDMSLLAMLPRWARALITRLRAPAAPAPTPTTVAPQVATSARAQRWMRYGPLRLVLKLLRHAAIRRAAVRACGGLSVQVVHASISKRCRRVSLWLSAWAHIWSTMHTSWNAIVSASRRSKVACWAGWNPA